jgi:hypothetical protein
MVENSSDMLRETKKWKDAKLPSKTANKRQKNGISPPFSPKGPFPILKYRPPGPKKTKG